MTLDQALTKVRAAFGDGAWFSVTEGRHGRFFQVGDDNGDFYSVRVFGHGQTLEDAIKAGKAAKK